MGVLEKGDCGFDPWIIWIFVILIIVFCLCCN